MTPHKHQAAINAWAAGAPIQVRTDDHDIWSDAGNPTWNPNFQYRIKHKHQDCIDAFGKGKQVQWRRSAAEAWKDCHVPSWSLNLEYRVKPETVRSRRYLMRRTTGEVCVSLINTDTGYDPSKASYFVRWIDDDWVETEV